MLTNYIIAAMAKAKYELIEDGTYFGKIPQFKGVWANAKTLKRCRQELQEVLEEWIVVSLRVGSRLPILPGVKPFPKKLKVAS
jgi:predicted RNase H-like HicB family nuclease